MAKYLNFILDGLVLLSLFLFVAIIGMLFAITELSVYTANKLLQMIKRLPLCQ